jgi:hypothetical protein
MLAGKRAAIMASQDKGCYYKAPAAVLKGGSKLVPTTVTAPTMTNVIRAAIKAYSIAVAPVSSFMILGSIHSIISPLLLRLEVAPRQAYWLERGQNAAFRNKGRRYRAAATSPKVLIKPVPTAVMEAIATTEIRAAINPYSIAVAPSTFCTGRTNLWINI